MWKGELMGLATDMEVGDSVRGIVGMPHWVSVAVASIAEREQVRV